MLLNITNIQHFSTGDGPGIRTTVFFCGCSLHCPWCHNPETISGKEVTLYYEQIGITQKCGGAVDESIVAEELLWDREYYEESGGGVTLSGGEVLLQPFGAASLAKTMRENGVNVAVDTAGFAPKSAVEALAPLCDLWLYDIKTADKERFAAVCGGDLDTVVGNLRYLISEKKNVRVRVPLIPGFNTGEEEIDGIVRLVDSVGGETVDLLPFHRLGSSKYAAMGLEYAYRDTKTPDDETIGRIRSAFARHFEVKVEKH
jgi:pyruvate formate lyase activating enzyme